jgi:homoserine kinase type II
MAKLTPLTLAEAREALAGWPFEVRDIEPFEGGSVNSNFRLETATGDRFFVRVYEEQDRTGAERELDLLEGLSRAGVPTPVAERRQDGARLAEHRGKPVAVFRWIDGEILCQKRVTERHANEVGRALARVHLAPVKLAHAGRFTLEHLRERLDVATAGEAFAEPVRFIRDALERYTERRDASLPTGVIHGDLFRDNVLWSGDQIVALLDFESASNGPFVYDLMVTVLAWCYGDAFDIDLCGALVSGYQSLRPLSERERAALQVEAALGALRFATTRITDYSLRAPPGTPPLRDYRRFLQRLSAIEGGALDALSAFGRASIAHR